LKVGAAWADASRGKKKVLSGCRKSNGDFTGYQRCNLPDILLLKANSDEHHAAKYPLIDIEPVSQIASSAA